MASETMILSFRDQTRRLKLVNNLHMKRSERPIGLAKSLTGIKGLDEITGGGLPKGGRLFVCGAAGCGKTMLGVEFIVHGAMEFNEPGVFMMFEESTEELAANVRSLGFDLEKLTAQNRIVVDHVYIERSEIEETGDYDLEGLFIRLGYAIDSVKAKRVVLDTLEALFRPSESRYPASGAATAFSMAEGPRRDGRYHR